jgi:hypothetical protein
MASDDFASRAAKLFGSLESHGAIGGVWNLNTQQGFAAGAEDQDSSEDGEAGPQSLPGAAGSDEDEDDYKVMRFIDPVPMLSPCMRLWKHSASMSAGLPGCPADSHIALGS